MKKTYLILSIDSDVGFYTAVSLAEKRYKLIVSTRRPASEDFIHRFGILKVLTDCSFIVLDAENVQKESLESLPNDLDGVMFCWGYCPKDNNPEEEPKITRINYSSIALLTSLLFPKLKSNATLLYTSSVASDRGRSSNYLYGAAKGALNNFAQGLAHKLALSQSNIRIRVLKPGYISSKMLVTPTPPLLTSKPSQAGRYCSSILDSNCKSTFKVLYYKKIWFFIMLTIRNLPASIFHRLKI